MVFLKDEDCSGKHFILGNPHTFHGRIMGFCPQKKECFYFSVTEIKSKSIETEYWIKGFLTGNEPEAPIDEDGDTIYSGEEYDFWTKSIHLFHEYGYWHKGQRHCDKCGKKLYNSWPHLECEECKK